MPAPVDPLPHLQALIRCPSVTPQEAGALDYLEGVLTAAGFRCRRLVFSEAGTADVDNLFARIGTRPPHLCFAGHSDVVPPGDAAAWSVPPFAGAVRQGTLIGRGAADMKGAIACFLAAALAALEAEGGKPPGSLSFLITGDEEAAAVNGTIKVLKWMAEHGEIPDHCIVGEPTNPARLGEAIKIGRRGSLNGELVVLGVQGHVAYPAEADNPLPKLARMIDRISAEALDQGSTDFEPSNLEVTTIDVGNPATNVIPAKASARFNIRFNDRHTPASLEQWIRLRCEAVRTELGGEFTLAFGNACDCFLTQPGPLTDLVGAAVEAETGVAPSLNTNGGTSDARFIKDYCPVLEFGLVSRTIHKVDEQVPLADLVQLTRIYRRIITDYFVAFGARS
jgi:succinyl-diaminopimelate desuccinylase